MTTEQQTHTPGPWTVRFHNAQGDLGGSHAHVENERWTYNLGDMEQDHADARLIAAAPDLLEAARLALKEMYGEITEGWDAAQGLMDAIEKATGK